MFWRKISDAEVIERARKNLLQLERWGRWITAWHVAIAVILCLAFTWAANVIFVKMIAGAQNRFEFILGLSAGVLFGTMLHQVIHALGFARVANAPDQRDRLLVQYHDALAECVGAQDDDVVAAP